MVLRGHKVLQEAGVTDSGGKIQDGVIGLLEGYRTLNSLIFDQPSDSMKSGFQSLLIGLSYILRSPAIVLSYSRLVIALYYVFRFFRISRRNYWGIVKGILVVLDVILPRRPEIGHTSYQIATRLALGRIVHKAGEMEAGELLGVTICRLRGFRSGGGGRVLYSRRCLNSNFCCCWSGISLDICSI